MFLTFLRSFDVLRAALGCLTDFESRVSSSYNNPLDVSKTGSEIKHTLMLSASVSWQDFFRFKLTCSESLVASTSTIGLSLVMLASWRMGSITESSMLLSLGDDRSDCGAVDTPGRKTWPPVARLPSTRSAMSSYSGKA